MTLPVSRVVNVSLLAAPVAAATRNFGSLLILGASDVIDAGQRLRAYADITSVAVDFGSSAPEYKAAAKYFSQQPKPTTLYIGRWVQVASTAVLKGGVLSAAEQDISNFTGITTGSMKITVDGTVKTVTALDLSGATNLNGVASALTAKLSTATATWNAAYNRFEIRSNTTGTSSTLSYAIAHTSGADVSALLGLIDGVASVPIDGHAPEPLIDAVIDVADKSLQWYGLTVAAAIATDEEVLAVSDFIEAAEPSRIFGHTISDPLALDDTSTTDLASKLKAANYGRTLVQYSTSSPYAVASLLGRAFSVNFQGENTTITLKFKQEPTVTAEDIATSQANSLQAKHVNVFAEYNNDTAIVQEGVMCDGTFIDERHGLDWLQNDLQTAIWNLHYTGTTKIPQTQAGVNRYCTTITARLGQARRNGLLAPGVWNGEGFGVLATGDYLTTGFYVFGNPIDTQSQADREARKSPPIQVAIKLAGAMHFVDVLVNFNR